MHAAVLPTAAKPIVTITWPQFSATMLVANFPYTNITYDSQMHCDSSLAAKLCRNTYGKFFLHHYNWQQQSDNTHGCNALLQDSQQTFFTAIVQRPLRWYPWLQYSNTVQHVCKIFVTSILLTKAKPIGKYPQPQCSGTTCTENVS